MKKIVYLSLAALALVGCNQSVDDYLSDIESAKEKVMSCKESSESSENCQNAKEAIKKFKVAEKEKQKIAKEKELQQLKVSLLSFSYKEYLKERANCSGIMCEAANAIKDEMLLKEALRIRSEINGDHNFPAYQKKVCEGLQADEVGCRMAYLVKGIIDKEWKAKISKKKAYFLENRADLKSAYNECRRTILSFRNNFLNIDELHKHIDELDKSVHSKISDASSLAYHDPRNSMSEEDYMSAISTYRYMGIMEDSMYIGCDAARGSAAYLNIPSAQSFRNEI